MMDMAEGIKENVAPTGGRCNFCGRIDEKLVPVVMEICNNCAEKFIKHSGELTVIEREHFDFNCDFCSCRSFLKLKVNPKICMVCVKRVGIKHKYDMKDALKDAARRKEKRWKRFQKQ